MDARVTLMSQPDLTHLSPGSHLCRFFRNHVDLARGAAAFVRSGLDAGDRVLYVTGDRSPEAALAGFAQSRIDVDEALGSGQLVLETADAAYGDGPLDFEELGDGFLEMQAKAKADGMAGLRVAAEMGDAAVRFGSLDALVAWEACATRLQREAGISSVCQYDRRRFTGDELAVVAAEHLGLSPKAATPALAAFRLTSRGLRIIGELDLSNRDDLLRVVRARFEVQRRVELDLGALTFSDVGSLAALYQLADRIPGAELRLRHASGTVQRVLTLSGLEHPRVLAS